VLTSEFSRSRLPVSTVHRSAHLHNSLQCPPPSISHNLCQYSIAICTPHVAASQPAYACLFALHTRTGRNMHITYTSPSDTDSFTQPQQSACMPIPSPTTIARRSRQDRLTAPRCAALRCVVTVLPDSMHVEPEPSGSTCKKHRPAVVLLCPPFSRAATSRTTPRLRSLKRREGKRCADDPFRFVRSLLLGPTRVARWLTKL
jgi:hypothetical protein